MNIQRKDGVLSRKIEILVVDFVAGLIVLGYGAALLPFVQGAFATGIF